jgi:anti-sigma factor RsiW
MIEHPFDDLHEFGLGELPPARAEALLDHADRCPTCAVLLAEIMQGVAALEADAPTRANALPLRVAPTSSNAIGEPVSRTRRASSSRAWPAVASLATAACLGLFAWNMQLRSAYSPLPPTPVRSLVHSHFVHHPLAGAPGAGSAKAIVAADGSWVFIVADQLAAENQYDVWETRGGRQIKLGTFTADGSGEGTAYFAVPAAKTDGFAVVPAGNDPATNASTLRWP